MRLSEAIRLGAMLKPQGFYAYVQRFIYDDNEVTCALGAAAQAIGSQCLDPYEVIGDLNAAFGPLLNAPRRRCPVTGCGVRRVTAPVITHLNDDHRWTREQIADWVESIETSAGLPRADAGTLDMVDARAPASDPPAGDDRVKECSSV